MATQAIFNGMCLDEVFEQKIKPYIHENKDGCWIWGRSIGKRGYGQLRFNGTTVKAHRLVAHIFLGLELSKSAVCVCHKCDVRSCINPKHLFLGSSADNIRDAAEKNRFPSGIRHHYGVRASRFVPEIFYMYNSGQSLNEISIVTGLRPVSISNILNKKTHIRESAGLMKTRQAGAPIRVKCITDGREFESGAEAARFYGIHIALVNRVAAGNLHSTHGLKFLRIGRSDNLAYPHVGLPV